MPHLHHLCPTSVGQVGQGMPRQVVAACRPGARLSSLGSVFEAPRGSEVEGGMLVRRVSAFSGIECDIVLPVTPAQLAAWRVGAPIQRAMPHLTPNQREFIKPGVTPDEWPEHI